MSVDTNVHRRRSLDAYHRARQDDIELLLAPGIAEHTREVAVSLRRFLVFRSLKATVALPDGTTLGRRAAPV